ncbi:DUF2478 domain-containing protein [Sedimentimonas flavescens]|uniref:DUF2478 domain-containing protein n=1 Tax=Sedimentimonas flavescens TaxID=2851012 RepID=UPI0021A5ED83|nr:DUF2478 domain-containing protein [Sedimentimonas flavescens]MCT2538802.1 DUF2478 domain-containing protein [Sedimentimonas flavescens]
MRLASVLATGRGETNRLLSDLAARASQRGLRVVGTVQVNHDPTDGKHCDMDVRVLPDGPVLRISQSLGTQSRGCRLDPSALEQAVRLTEGALESGADLMIVNKFGKHEAEGRGFRELIGSALMRGIPVIVGLNGLNIDAFADFAGAFAERLDPTGDAIAAWLDADCPEQSARRAV